MLRKTRGGEWVYSNLPIPLWVWRLPLLGRVGRAIDRRNDRLELASAGERAWGKLI